jgi:Flp pilus assembly protein TadD
MLALLAAFGLISCTDPEPETPPPAASADTPPAASSEPPLVRILVAVDGEPPGQGADVPWLAEEVRYLLARQGAVRLAHPDGPHDPQSDLLYTLALEVPAADTGKGIRLVLHAPGGEILEYQRLGVRPETRLELIERIAEHLGAVASLGTDDTSLALLIGTDDAELYDSYTRSHVERLRSMRNGTAVRRSESASRTLERYERMTRRDPDFARAWSALALAYLDVRGQDEDALAKLADDAARRALALDPKLPEAEAALGRTRYRYGEWLEAEDHLIAALGADAAAPTALEAYACFLLDLGRVAYARRVSAQALGTVPGANDARECLAIADLASSDLAAAAATLGEPSEGDSAGIARARALIDIETKDFDAARISLAAAAPRARNPGVWLDPVLTSLRNGSGTPSALRAITRAADVGRIDAATETLLGGELGQPDFVFNRLLRMRAQRRAVPLRLLWLPQSAYLREHPRFREIIDELELETYWNQRARPDYCRETPTLPGCG